MTPDWQGRSQSQQIGLPELIIDLYNAAKSAKAVKWVEEAEVSSSCGHELEHKRR